MVSRGTEFFLAVSMAACRRAFRSGSDPPALTATMISFASLPKSWPRFSALISRPFCFHWAPMTLPLLAVCRSPRQAGIIGHRFRWNGQLVASIEAPMNSVRTLLGLLAVLVLCVLPSARGQDGAPPTGAYKFKTEPFDDLSDRNVSRQGDTALHFKGVTWEHGESDHFILHT